MEDEIWYLEPHCREHIRYHWTAGRGILWNKESSRSPLTKTLLDQTLDRPFWALFSTKPHPFFVLLHPFVAKALLSQFSENPPNSAFNKDLVSGFSKTPPPLSLMSPLSNFLVTDLTVLIGCKSPAAVAIFELLLIALPCRHSLITYHSSPE